MQTTQKYDFHSDPVPWRKKRKNEDPERCLWWAHWGWLRLGTTQTRNGNPRDSPVLPLEEQMSRKTSVGHLAFLYGGSSFLRKASDSRSCGSPRLKTVGKCPDAKGQICKMGM